MCLVYRPLTTRCRRSNSLSVVFLWCCTRTFGRREICTFIRRLLSLIYDDIGCQLPLPWEVERPPFVIEKPQREKKVAAAKVVQGNLSSVPGQVDKYKMHLCCTLFSSFLTKEPFVSSWGGYWIKQSNVRALCLFSYFLHLDRCSNEENSFLIGSDAFLFGLASLLMIPRHVFLIMAK